KPAHAISMLDTDCEVDFAQPLDYKEHEKKESVLGTRKSTTSGDDEDRKSRPIEVDGKLKSKQGTTQFKPFSGVARRLDGQPLMAVVAKDVEYDQSNVQLLQVGCLLCFVWQKYKVRHLLCFVLKILYILRYYAGR
ncbi:ubiquitin fusion degradation protein 1, partial [Tanacetum coccineum]